MINLKDPNEVAGLKSNMHATFDTAQGKEIMSFLEQSCCWYQSCLVPGSPDMSLVNDGKRQVLATIKSILKFTPEQISALVTQAEAA